MFTHSSAVATDYSPGDGSPGGRTDSSTAGADARTGFLHHTVLGKSPEVEILSNIPHQSCFDATSSPLLRVQDAGNGETQMRTPATWERCCI